MNRILIAGAGRMGLWFALMLRDEYDVSVYDPFVHSEKIPSGVKYLAGAEDIVQFRPDILLNCVSIESTIRLFEELDGLIPESCLLADIASVKGKLKDFYSSSGRRFISIHPMFGPTFASFENMRGLNAIIIDESDDSGKEFISGLLEPAGVELSYSSFSEHDELMASVLTAPFISTLMFALCTDKSHAGGTTWSRHMEIAEGLLHEEPQLLANIISNGYSVGKIELMIQLLSRLKELVGVNDTEGIKEIFRVVSEDFFRISGQASQPYPQL
jgi:prephenate dehydrogenase